ncbi:MAG: single-stranded-DNA-specific exonuclease RecJ [Clostridiales bacterium]|jgi:single-stranded-DNA-specific exonuclease|nr:single-stranded-DNA-specific exonuclease RecJ [Clostridiales bacterium]
MHRVIKQIIESRGIGENEREEFFSPRPQLAYNPFLLANMREGVDLLLDAVDEGRNIVIYGDYDVDGITSTSLMMKVIGSLTDKVSYYIPSRFDEGYGLHNESIDRIHENGGEFILTVDCGSVSKEETEYAHSLGIQTLVTDHHNMSSISAEGLIINPMQEEDEYPFKGLAGVGVAYKLALAISRIRPIPKEIMAEALEFAAVGTIADIMVMKDENRTIVKCGLRFMKLGCHNIGLRNLIKLSGLDYSKLKTSDISFCIAPRLNAAGRLGDASLGVKLFLSETESEAIGYCNMLIEANHKRRSLQDEAFSKSLEIANNNKEDDFLLLEVNDAHEGVLGIVAGKLRENVNRPVVIITKSGDYYKGTGRSISTVNLFDMLDKYRDSFISFGGHSAACGFSILPEKVDELRTNLNQDIEELYKEKNNLFDIEYHYDAELEISDVSLELANDIQMLEPCGKGNEIPEFKLSGVIPVNWKFLKGEKKHAKFTIASKHCESLECLIFQEAEKYEEIATSNTPVDIIGVIEVNHWRDSVKPQLRVRCILPEGGLCNDR